MESSVEETEKILSEGQKLNKQQSLNEKELQSEIPKQYGDEDYGWLKCNTEPRKTSSIFALQEQMIETRAWKKIRGLVGDDKCRLCGEHRETVQHILSGCTKLSRIGVCQTTWQCSKSACNKMDYWKWIAPCRDEMGKWKDNRKWRKEVILELGAPNETWKHSSKSRSYFGRYNK